MRRIDDDLLESDVGGEKFFRTVSSGTTPGIIVVILSGGRPAERLSCWKAVSAYVGQAICSC
jgi:hypothetical protein